jgi:hypothetical protein
MTGVECAAVAAVAVEGDTADRGPRLREDPALCGVVLHVSLLEVRMGLDLVERRHHRGVLEKRREVPHHEVADADRANLAVGEQVSRAR